MKDIIKEKYHYMEKNDVGLTTLTDSNLILKILLIQ